MKQSKRVYLGFDLGASSGRAVLGVLAGQQLRIEEIHRFGNAPLELGGTLYWDFLALWQNVIDSMRICARRGQAKVSAIGIDTWGVDCGFLGADGKLIANPLCYRDGITEGVERVITSKVGTRRLYELTGLALTRVSTLAQLVGLSRSPSKVMLKSAQTLLMMSDLFRYFLCGHKAVELTAAGSSQLANVRSAKWSAKLFSALGLPRRIMPKIASPATVAGKLLGELSAQTGIGPTPVVTVAGHDTASAAVAAPFVEEDCAFISTGTWSALGVVLDRPITTPAALTRGFMNEFGLDSMLFVRNMMGLYIFENLRRTILRAGEKVSYPQMIRQAARARPFRRLLDVNSPMFFIVEDPRGPIREFLRRTGQGDRITRADITRALLEGLAWSYRESFGHLEEVTGRTFRRVCVLGGGSRNAMLCQLVADATGLEVIAGPAEATMAGNLAIQALATGQLRRPEDIRELVRNSFKLRTYKPQSTEIWDRHAERYARIAEKSRKLK